MRRRRIERGGSYVRVADPDWSDPLDGAYAQARGGRWNPAGTYAVVYLNRDWATGRHNVDRLLAGQPYGPEDLDPAEAYILVETEVPHDRYLDVVTDAGCRSAGLPETYPRNDDDTIVGHAACAPIGLAVHDEGLPGVACRSAAPGASRDNEELAHFSGAGALAETRRWAFDDWYWGDGGH
ncbi:MAG: hypothetical protein JWR63_340 [Conexibacter sp.]|nr:hypothetical protein [Conexibacter sp.]